MGGYVLRCYASAIFVWGLSSAVFLGQTWYVSQNFRLAVKVYTDTALSTCLCLGALALVAEVHRLSQNGCAFGCFLPLAGWAAVVVAGMGNVASPAWGALGFLVTFLLLMQAGLVASYKAPAP